MAAPAISVPALTLVMPDLCLDGVTSWPTLERLLARADPLIPGTTNTDLDTNLFKIFGAAADEPLPVAAVTHALDSDDTSPGWWIRADPVYLHLHHNHLVLFDQRVLKLSYDDAVRLAREISPPPWLWKENIAPNFCLEVLEPTRWYLRLPQLARIQTSKLSALHAQDIRAHLPQGEQGKAWQLWLNECQIILHNSPINVEREARGDLPVNSLWFWGEGYTPIVTSSIFHRVWSNHPVALGLARISATPHTIVPLNAEVWLNQCKGAGNHLVVLDDLPTEAQQRWEHEWFMPLQKALRTGIIASLVIYPGATPPRRISATQVRRHWWRW